MLQKTLAGAAFIAASALLLRRNVTQQDRVQTGFLRFKRHLGRSPPNASDRVYP
jgi:hypothetical protein